MPPLTLEGDTLGQKHRNYNKLVEDAVTNKHYKLKKINSDDSDIENLIKIDVASKTRNVVYIIETMKSNDMLYASRAIKVSTWLITEPQYADVINPKYLHTQMFPSMITKAINKLMLHIRLNLKDERRIETFYEYLKDTDESYKWLLNCSIPFIRNVIHKKTRVPLSVFKRLCERSVIFLAYHNKVEELHNPYHVLKQMSFLIKSNTEEILNILEDDKFCFLPTFNSKYTEIVMKNCPHRILDKFEKYVSSVNLAVVAKYIKQEDIEDFLYKHVRKENVKCYLSDYEHLKHFVKHMPENNKYEFIKKTFIDKTNVLPPDEFCTDANRSRIPCEADTYLWYQFAPFNVAFTEIKKLIHTTTTPTARCEILSVLITSAEQNPQHIKTLLKFYYEKHVNEPFKFKVRFINDVLTHTASYEFDVETWNILDQLFHSMAVYNKESANNVQTCLQSIILYKVLHDEKVPDVIEQKVTFDTFKTIQKKLSEKQMEKLFTYLLTFISSQIQKQIITNEFDFQMTVDLLKDALTLLTDWKKNVTNYSFVLNKIQELIIIKQKNSWNTDLSDLYNINKSWRRHMFEYSLSMSLSEEACLNALKHGPQLLTRHDKDVTMLRTNDTISLRRLLAKLRIYWQHTIAQQWTDMYLQNLNNPIGQKALIKGLFMLLPQKKIVDIAMRHVPTDFKINWGETEQDEIELRKHIAQNLHVARPLAPLDAVLWYAKGDYLQYAVPSLNAISHYLSHEQTREHLPKLLEAPVSLQKFGLHLAYFKLKTKELSPIFLKAWESSKNPTIRVVLFMHTYNLLRKTKNLTEEQELWELLCKFIDNLSSDENKEIYKKLGIITDVSPSIQAEYFMKGYKFVTSLPKNVYCESYVTNLLNYAPTVIESLDDDFVYKLLSPIEKKICAVECNVIDILVPYVLFGKTEEDQLQRYRKVLVLAMEHAIQSWNKVHENEYYVKNNFNRMLKTLIWNFRKLVTLHNITIPVKLFVEIKNKMKEILPLEENYVLYTSWKLIAEYVKLINEHKYMFSAFKTMSYTKRDIGKGWMSAELEEVWFDIHAKISPTLGPLIVNCLKEDNERYFPTICWIFAEALRKMIEDLCFQRKSFIMETLEYMLDDKDFIPSYIVVCSEVPYVTYDADDVRRKRSEIREKIKAHPSNEVQMHYNRFFSNIPEDVL